LGRRWVIVVGLISRLEQELVGFSMVRWGFWKQRLDEIAESYMASSEKELEEEARHCYRFLDTWEDIVLNLWNYQFHLRSNDSLYHNKSALMLLFVARGAE
jgi:hypothetical protein